ncbi:MAG: hypothetical protein J2P17_20645, partial [Mycobacterium sp.]|nr:hypothetical protein [Mycobacterium sp.]
DPTDDASAEGPSEPPSRSRRVVQIGAPILAVLLLIASVWTLGGFKDRDDTITDVAAGQTFTDGPFEFHFTKATIQQEDTYDNKPTDKVVVSGTVQNTWNESLPTYASEWFLARPRHGGQVQKADIDHLGDPKLYDAPDEVAPGLDPSPYSIEFEFSPPLESEKSLLFVARELTYESHAAYGTSGNPYWDSGSAKAYRMQLPLTRLPPEN